MLLQKRLYWLDIGRLVEQSQIFPLDLRVFICFARVVACGLVVASPLFNDEAVLIALAAKEAFRLRLRVKLPQFHKQHALLVQQHACHFGISVLQLLERSGILCRKRAHRTDIPTLNSLGASFTTTRPEFSPDGGIQVKFDLQQRHLPRLPEEVRFAVVAFFAEVLYLFFTSSAFVSGSVIVTVSGKCSNTAS